MQKLKIAFPYLLINAVCYYASVLWLQDTGSAMMIVLVGLPAVIIMLSFLHVYKSRGNLFLYAIGAGLLFLPVVFFWMNESALIYVGVYAALACLGGGFGQLINRRTRT